MRRGGLAGLWVALLSLAACSSTLRLYEGPPRAPEDIATINVKVDDSAFSKLVLELYDGRPINRSLRQGYTVELEPGLHTLWLHGRKKRPPIVDRPAR